MPTVLALLAVVLAGLACYWAYRARRTSHHLALEMVQLRERFAHMERAHRARQRRERVDAEREAASTSNVTELGERLRELEARVGGFQRFDAVGGTARGPGAVPEASEGGGSLRETIARGLRAQGYAEIFVLDVTEDDRVLVEVEQAGIKSKGVAWVEPDGRVALRARSTHRAFP